MTNTLTLHLTDDNIETELLPGDVFADDPGFGSVTGVWHTGDGVAYITSDHDEDVFGVPATVEIIRNV